MTGNLATIGIDIGGTRMRVGRRDPSGRLVAERTASPPDPEEGVAQLVALARGLAPAGVGRVGGSAPGPLDLAPGPVAPLNMPGWDGDPPVAEAAAGARPTPPTRPAPESPPGGGGPPGGGARLFAPLRRKAAELIHIVPLPRIVPAGLGQDSGLLGAIVLAEA